jgi:hypothetical protein
VRFAVTSLFALLFHPFVRLPLRFGLKVLGSGFSGNAEADRSVSRWGGLLSDLSDHLLPLVGLHDLLAPLCLALFAPRDALGFYGEFIHCSLLLFSWASALRQH